jgi:uncharacterized membrane protein
MEILKAIWTVYSIISVVFTTFFLIGLITNVRKELNLTRNIETVKNSIKIVYIEEVGSAYFMYDKLTQRFICQASSESEALQKAESMFPGFKVLTTTKEEQL